MPTLNKSCFKELSHLLCMFRFNRMMTSPKKVKRAENSGQYHSSIVQCAWPSSSPLKFSLVSIVPYLVFYFIGLCRVRTKSFSKNLPMRWSRLPDQQHISFYILYCYSIALIEDPLFQLIRCKSYLQVNSFCAQQSFCLRNRNELASPHVYKDR